MTKDIKKPYFSQPQVDYLVDWIHATDRHHDFKIDSMDTVAMTTASDAGKRILVSHIQDLVNTQV